MPEPPAKAEPDILSEFEGLADGVLHSDELAEPAAPEPTRTAPTRKRTARASTSAMTALPGGARSDDTLPDDAPVADRSMPRVVAAPVTAAPVTAAPVTAAPTPDAHEPGAGAEPSPLDPNPLDSSPLDSSPLAAGFVDADFVEFEADFDSDHEAVLDAALGLQPTAAVRPAAGSASPDAPDAPATLAAPEAPEVPEAPLTPADLALHARGADAATWLAARVGHRMDEALAAANRELLAMTPSAQANGTHRTPSHQRAAAVLLHHGFGLDKRQPGVRTAFSATAGPNAGGPLAVFVIEDGALPAAATATATTETGTETETGTAETHAAAVLGGALALAAVAPGLGLTVRVLGVPGSDDSSALRSLVKDGFVDGATVVLTARGGERAEVGTNPPADRQWDVVFTGRSASATGAGPLAAEAADAVVLARAAIDLSLRHLPQGASVVVSNLPVASTKSGAPKRTGLSVRLHGASPEVLDSTADRVESCLEAAVLGTGTSMKRTVRTPAASDLRQDSVLVGAYRSAADRRGNEVGLVAATASSAGLGLISQDVPTLHPSVPRGSGSAAHYALLDAAYGLAVAAAAGCLAGTARDAGA